MDLKPKNLVFNSHKFKKIILLDFGISKIAKENEETDVIGMSYCYCAPEIKEASKCQVSSKSDIFSFGMFFFALFYYIFLKHIV